MNENLKTAFQPPYLGAAYYPEDWPDDQIDFDIAKMKEAGINAARIGEFAWHKMEPKPGQFDFAWLHHVVDKLGAAGIAVILGTPTATPPRWFTVAHPDSLRETDVGVRTNHGGRRHCCSNHPAYREASARIVEAMAREFATDPYVIGWQCDNEIYEGGDGCLCEHCQQRFLTALRQKYGTAEALNKAWNLNLFSQAYDRFEDIPLPVHAWVNPHHRLEWRTAQNDAHVDFIHMQAEILHRYVSVPVGTDTMPFGAMDYREMFDKLDVVQFNHYNVPENLQNVCFWFDFLRPLKKQPFWNTETATCWNGSVSVGQSIKPENFCKLNSWLPLALGGEANMYWLWRTHWAGHELTHGSVLDSSGRPQHIWGEVQETAAEFQKAAAFLNETRVEAEAAIHFTARNWNLWATQPLFNGADYMQLFNDLFYRPLLDLGVRTDGADAAQPLENYRFLASPMMMTMDEKELPERIRTWVENGGVWMTGPLTDIRNYDGAKFENKPFGFLEDLLGECWRYGIPDAEDRIQTEWSDGACFHGSRFYQTFDLPDGAEPWVQITEGHSALKGQAVVFHKPYGKGHVIVLGTFPSPDDMRKLYTRALNLAGINCGASPDGNLVVVPRRGAARKGLILAEYANRGGRYQLEQPMTDLLTGRTLAGEIHVKPYEVLVLEA
mgnify:FL=1